MKLSPLEANSKVKNNTALCLLLILFATLLLHVVIQFGSIGLKLPFFGDFSMRWKECAYFLKGINPFDALAQNMVIPSIGGLSSASGTVPWAYVLGNVFNPGFLPYNVALVYGMALYFILPVVAAFFLYGFLKKNYLWQNTKYLFYTTLLVFLPAQWANAIRFGNQAGPVCCILLIVMCIVDEHPITSGVLFGLAMVKPQVAAPFFLVFLLQKKHLTAVVSVLVVVFAWVVSFLVTSTPPFQMVVQMLHQGTSYVGTYTYYGLFDFLDVFAIAPTFILLLDIIAAGIFLLVCYLLLRRFQLQNNTLIAYSCAAVASTFWFYKQVYDLLVLCIPAVFLFLAFWQSPATKKRITSFVITGYLLLSNMMSPVASRAIAIFLDVDRDMWITPFVKAAERFFYMAVVVFLIIKAGKSATPEFWQSPVQETKKLIE